MKKLSVLLIVSAAALFFVSCDLATTYNLPANPVSRMSVEILDQSKIASSSYSDAISYYNVLLSAAGWKEYIKTPGAVKTPDSTLNDVGLSYVENSDETITVSGALGMDAVPQGNYRLDIDVADEDGNWWSEETFNYIFDISIGGTGPLSVRNPGSYTASAPYVCGTETAITLAISDDEDTLYI